MKRLICLNLATAIVIIAVSTAKAQIKVFNTSQVQVGGLWWPTFPSTKQLFINGGLEVREYPGTAMFIQNYHNLYNGTWYDDPSIVSHFNYGGWVGTPGQAMFAVYTNFLYAAGVQITSDERLKTNIKTIKSKDALEKIKLIKSYTYDYNEAMLTNTEESKKEALLKSGKNQVGFMAQELGQILPEAVKVDEKNGTYSVNYTMLIPILVEAVKEQQNKIAELEQKINELKQK